MRCVRPGGTKRMMRSTVALVAAVAAVTVGSPGAAAAAASSPHLAIVMDDATDSAVVFDLRTNKVVGSVDVHAAVSATVGSCAIRSGQGFVTNFASTIDVLDLRKAPPALADGANSIPIDNFGEDLGLTANGKFLVVADGSNVQPLSIINTKTRTQIAAFATGTDSNSVSVLRDGSILVTSFNTHVVRRLNINERTGAVTDTGESLSLGVNEPNNTFAPARGGTALVIGRQGGGLLESFAIDGLRPLDSTFVGDVGLSGVASPDGTRLYVRTASGIKAFTYDPATGAIGTSPLFDVATGEAQTFFGIDQIAISADGTRIYDSEPNALVVRDATDGHALTSITDPHIAKPSGICLP